MTENFDSDVSKVQKLIKEGTENPAEIMSLGISKKYKKTILTIFKVLKSLHPEITIAEVIKRFVNVEKIKELNEVIPGLLPENGIPSEEEEENIYLSPEEERIWAEKTLEICKRSPKKTE